MIRAAIVLLLAFALTTPQAAASMLCTDAADAGNSVSCEDPAACDTKTDCELASCATPCPSQPQFANSAQPIEFRACNGAIGAAGESATHALSLGAPPFRPPRAVSIV